MPKNDFKNGICDGCYTHAGVPGYCYVCRLKKQLAQAQGLAEKYRDMVVADAGETGTDRLPWEGQRP